MKQMKLNTYRFLFLLLFLSGAGSVWGQVKETKVDQTFNVSSNTELRIDNKFGKVHINTWDQNRIQAKVEVEVDGSESGAREILSRINIDVHESSSQVKLETDISESKNSRNRRFRINYTVTMPKGNPLNVNHRHGDIYLDNHSGALVLELAHGQIVAEELTGETRVSLQHGSGGRIASLGSGTLEIQHYQRLRLGKLGDMRVDIAHASAEVEEAGDLDLEIRHSTLEFEVTGALNLELQHSKLRAESIKSIDVDMQHSTIDIEKVASAIIADGNHSHVKVDRLSKNFSKVSFDGNHSYLGVGLESGVRGTLEIELNHGKLDYPESLINMSHVNIENNSRKYKGKIGNGSGGEIMVDGNFTDVDLEIN
jgi:hypothetical protein